MKIRTYLATLLLVILLQPIKAQYFPIDTMRLNHAYRALEKDFQCIPKQKEFFNAFPKCWTDYYSTYKYSDAEGYDLSMYSQAYNHIQALEKCTQINDNQYCNKLIALSVGATLDADAPNYLKTLLHRTMKKKADTFLHCLSKIKKGHQMQFWQFYWSNIIHNKEYVKEAEELYNKYHEKYPEMMKTMSIAHEYFNNGVIFMTNLKIQ